jgi:hypothetical protein
LNADGTTDIAFEPVVGFNFGANVLEFGEQTDGKLLVGGGFSSFDNIGTESVLRLSGSSLATNEFQKSKMHLFPNPTTSILNIQTQNEIAAIKIFDVAGRTTNIKNYSNNAIDVSSLASGVYIVEVQTLEDIFREKFLKL